MESNNPADADAEQQSRETEDPELLVGSNIIVSYQGSGFQLYLPSSVMQFESTVHPQNDYYILSDGLDRSQSNDGAEGQNVFVKLETNLTDGPTASMAQDLVSKENDEVREQNASVEVEPEPNLTDVKPPSSMTQELSMVGHENDAFVKSETNLSVYYPPLTMAQDMSVDVQNEGGGEQSNEVSLTVNHLPPSMTEAEFRSLFADIGEVSGCKLVVNIRSGRSLGYGFVRYNRPEDAETAIRDLNGLRLLNRNIKVGKSRPRCRANEESNLYVFGLPNIMTKEELASLFSPYGAGTSARILYENTTKRQNVNGAGGGNRSRFSKGFGFVTLNGLGNAERAIKELDGTLLQGGTYPLTVKFANWYSKRDLALVTEMARSPRLSDRSSLTENSMVANGARNGSGWCIFVLNLPPETEENSLWRLFGPFGAIQKVQVMCFSSTRRCKGYAFVTMNNFHEAACAIQALNGFKFGDRALQVRFKTEKKQ